MNKSMRVVRDCKFYLPLLGVLCCLYSAALSGCQPSKKVSLDFQNTRSRAAVGDAEHSAKDSEESVRQLKRKNEELSKIHDSLERTVVRTEGVSRKVGR